MDQSIKVLLCDDEHFVVEMIRRLVDWDALGMTIAGTTMDGLAAYNFIVSQRPDIVITDIRMPGMDGLELLKAVSSLAHVPRFVLISGHKQFDYAYSAIKYGVEDYLLKPIKAQELTRILVKLRDEILQKSIHTQSDSEVYSQLEFTRSKLREQFLEQLCQQSLPLHLTCEIMRSNYGYTCKNPLYQIVCLVCDRDNKSITNEAEEETLLLKQVRNAMREAVTPYCDEMEVLIRYNQLIVLLNYSNTDTLLRYWKRLLPELRNKVAALAHSSVTIALGIVVDQVSLLKDSLDAAQRAIRSRYILGVNQVIDDAMLIGTEIDPRSIITYERWQLFDQIIEMLHITKMQKWLRETNLHLIVLCQNNPCLFPDAIEYIYNLFTLSTRKLISFEFTPSMTLQSILDHSSAQDVWDSLSQCILNDMQSTLNLKQASENKPIRVAKQYILDHLDQDITLEMISETVYLNPAYFCSLFKKETGVNFQNYVMEMRIERAKNLLKDAKLSVAEVSCAVGYRDTRYFSQLFKKKVGMTPKEFSKLFS